MNFLSKRRFPSASSIGRAAVLLAMLACTTSATNWKCTFCNQDKNNHPGVTQCATCRLDRPPLPKTQPIAQSNQLLAEFSAEIRKKRNGVPTTASRIPEGWGKEKGWGKEQVYKDSSGKRWIQTKYGWEALEQSNNSQPSVPQLTNRSSDPLPTRRARGDHRQPRSGGKPPASRPQLHQRSLSYQHKQPSVPQLKGQLSAAPCRLTDHLQLRSGGRVSQAPLPPPPPLTAAMLRAAKSPRCPAALPVHSSPSNQPPQKPKRFGRLPLNSKRKNRTELSGPNSGVSKRKAKRQKSSRDDNLRSSAHRRPETKLAGKGDPSKTAVPKEKTTSEEEWTCKVCTLVNAAKSERCAACHSPPEMVESRQQQAIYNRAVQQVVSKPARPASKVKKNGWICICKNFNEHHKPDKDGKRKAQRRCGNCRKTRKDVKALKRRLRTQKQQLKQAAADAVSYAKNEKVNTGGCKRACPSFGTSGKSQHKRAKLLAQVEVRQREAKEAEAKAQRKLQEAKKLLNQYRHEFEKLKKQQSMIDPTARAQVSMNLLNEIVPLEEKIGSLRREFANTAAEYSKCDALKKEARIVLTKVQDDYKQKIDKELAMHNESGRPKVGLDGFLKWKCVKCDHENEGRKRKCKKCQCDNSRVRRRRLVVMERLLEEIRRAQ